MKMLLVSVVMIGTVFGSPAGATSIVNYSEDEILNSLARVTLSAAHCSGLSRPMFNALDLVWDVVELKAGADPNDPVVSKRYFEIMEQREAEAKQNKSEFCQAVVADFGPHGQVIADLVLLHPQGNVTRQQRAQSRGESTVFPLDP